MKTQKLTPNHYSKFQTPGSLQIDLHYADLQVVRRWTWERFHRLASFLRLTYGELASLICLPHGQLKGVQARNYFPGPAALLLTLLEAQVMAAYSNDIISNPFPSSYAPSQSPSEVQPDA